MRRPSNRHRREFQSDFLFDAAFRRGGKRRGAGRKPKGKRAGVSHKTRYAVSAHEPQHVTAKLRAGLPTLREARAMEVLCGSLYAAKERLGVRLVHFSAQTDHLHLIVEAQNRAALSRGLQGLFVRIAKALNKLWRRKGTVFADRFHVHGLKTPRETRNALAYVLQNAAKHGLGRGRVDPFSSGSWFQGWKRKVRLALADFAAPVAQPRSWLLRLGWQRWGLIDPWEVPGGCVRE